MSIFSDLLSIFSGGSGSQTTTTVATANNSTSVAVNPTILNAVDLSALASPLQNLVDSFAAGRAVEIDAAKLNAQASLIQAAAISDAADKNAAAVLAASKVQSAQSQSLADQFSKLGTWVALGTLGISLYKIAKA